MSIEDNSLTLEKMRVVEQLQAINQSQAIMREQISSFKIFHENIQKILDRHDLILLGDGSQEHIGVSGRLKVLEDDMKSRDIHHKVLYTGLVSSIFAHIYKFFFGH